MIAIKSNFLIKCDHCVDCTFLDACGNCLLQTDSQNDVDTYEELYSNCPIQDIVECKDCLYYNAASGNCVNVEFFRNKRVELKTNYNGFCSKGVRKGGTLDDWPLSI